MKNGNISLVHDVHAGDCDDSILLMDRVFEELKDIPLLEAVALGKQYETRKELLSFSERDLKTLYAQVEDAFTCILNIYVWGRDRCFLLESMEALARKLSTLPAEEVRLLLRKTSPRVDAILLFSGLWGTLSYRDVLILASEKKCEGNRSARSYAQHFSVPFVAFLLAGTNFLFTDEELSGICSGSGVRLVDVRNRAEVSTERCGEYMSRKSGYANKEEEAR